LWSFDAREGILFHRESATWHAGAQAKDNTAQTSVQGPPNLTTTTTTMKCKDRRETAAEDPGGNSINRTQNENQPSLTFGVIGCALFPLALAVP
jgi:hypothetical protein